MRLFLDANVLFSAARGASGNCAALFALAGHGNCALVSSRFAIEEAARNLSLKDPDCLREFERLLQLIEVAPAPPAATVAIARRRGLPPKDAPILAAAVASRVTILVTGDQRHFGKLFGRQIDGVTVMTPAQAVEHLL
jgi:predicted nucleic acid-binding protein